MLFDVDGTLLLTHDEVYVEASRLALEEVFGTDADGPDVPGDTAPTHVRRALRAAGLEESEIDAGLPRWCTVFSARYVELLGRADTSHWELGPHAKEAVAAREPAGNWRPERTVAVGDTPLDVSSAHAGGSRCIGVTTGRYNETALHGADAVISDLSELERALSTLE